MQFVDLNAQRPAAPRIRSLSVQNNTIEIEWEQLTDARINKYVVYYGRYVGNPFPSWTPIDTVFTPLTFLSVDPADLRGVDVFREPVTFAVNAITNTGETSVYDKLDWDSTVFLQGEFDECLAMVQLNWNPYKFYRWTYGARNQVVFVSQNGSPYTPFDTLADNASSYQFKDLLANYTYGFYIGSVADTLTADTSYSIPVEVETGMARLPEYMYADYATNSGGNAALSFSIDPESEIDTYEILRSNSVGGKYEPLERLSAENNSITYTDAIDWAAGPYFYRLDAINFCDENIRTSANAASTLLLNIQGEPLDPVLNWNRYQYWLNGVSSYRIDRKIGDEEYSPIASVVDTTFTDNGLTALVETGRAAKVCYNITATENNNPYGIDAESLSNEYCIELPVNIRFEYDGFMPGTTGFGSTFGPTMDFVPDFIDYKVVDRGGQVLFSSKDPETLLWDGTFNGSFVNQGAYMYVLKYRVGDGKNKTLRGGFVVAYP